MSCALAADAGEFAVWVERLEEGVAGERELEELADWTLWADKIVAF